MANRTAAPKKPQTQPTQAPGFMSGLDLPPANAEIPTLPTPAQMSKPAPVQPQPIKPDVDARTRITEGLGVGQKWVDGMVPDGVLGRHTDSYRPNVDNLINVQQDNLKGYDSSLMRDAARSQAQALAGGAAAFGNKISGPAGSVAMAPHAQNAAQLYQSGVTADNATAKDLAFKAASDYLPRAAGEELAIDQSNRALGQKEKTLRNTLPFDIVQLLEGTRTGMLGDEDAKWLSELTRRLRGSTNTINDDIDKAQGR